MSERYPVLAEMGVQNPREIDRFSVFAVDDTDILKITYNRKKGSMLPESRKYRFPRIKRTELIDSGTRQTGVIFESSNEFRNAVAELEQLLRSRKSREQIRELVSEEIRHLEEDVSVRIQYLKSLIEKM